MLELVEQGKLRLDVPLKTYLPKPYVQGDDRLNKITARIVLSHRTGFPYWRVDGKPLTIHFTPGERFSYSGEGYIYLMTSSSYVWRPNFDERTATGHDGDGKPVALWKPKEAGTASNLNTTAKDYALFVEAVLIRKPRREW